MSKKRKHKPSSSSNVQQNQNPVMRSRRLSYFLNKAESCLPIDAMITPISQDLIFIENGHLLTTKIRTRLLIAKVMLQGLEQGSHLFGDDIRVPVKITYNELSETVCRQITELGIPAIEEQPFLFDYDRLGLFLPSKIRINEFYDAFLELMLNEWKICYLRKLFNGFGFEEWANQTPFENQQLLRNLLKETAGKEVLEAKLSIRTARGLCFASECIVRIRAQWDKLLKQLILEKMLGSRKANKLSFEKAYETLQKYHDSFETGQQQECLDALIRLATQTVKLRQWRDDELHRFSQTVFGVFEREKTDESLGGLYKMVIEEHNRVREGIVAMIGMIMLGSQKSSIYYKGKWPSPTRYIDFENSDEVAKNALLVQMVNQQMKLKEDITQASSDKDRINYQEKILKVAMQIYYLVCELYGMESRENNKIREPINEVPHI